jgi:ParB-like chromosome segregation protein Spo0J
MRQGVELVAIDKLRAHEQVCPQRLAAVMNLIREKGEIVNPIIMDRKTRVILDGHHRAAGLTKLGYKLIPVMAVDYFSDKVKVFLRREELIKKIVISRALKKRLLPSKTTRHFIKNRIRG